MSLNSVLNNAWDFLEKSLKDKKAMAEAEAKRLSQIEAEREKTKRMQISSQEKIQLLINKGLLDRQELVNQGLLTQKEMEESGLKDRQESENRTKRDIAKIDSRTRLDVSDKENAGAYKRAELEAKTKENVADIEARNKWYTLKDYSKDGSISERLVNPNLPPETADPGQLEKLEEKIKTQSASEEDRLNVIPSPMAAAPPTSGATINSRSIGTSSPAVSSPVINPRPMAYTSPQNQTYGLVGNVGPGRHVIFDTLSGATAYQRSMPIPYARQTGQTPQIYHRRMDSLYSLPQEEDEMAMPKSRRMKYLKGI